MRTFVKIYRQMPTSYHKKINTICIHTYKSFIRSFIPYSDILLKFIFNLFLASINAPQTTNFYYK